MLLEKFKNSVKGPALAATLSVACLGAFSTAVHAEDAQCSSLKQNRYGHQMGAGSSAHLYSQQNVGAVGISIFPGADLEISGFTAHQLGAKLVSVLNKAGVKAECFVNDSLFENNGTALGFQIDGFSITVDGQDAFGMRQIQEDKRILRSAVAEAKTAKMLLASEKPDLALNQ